MDLNLRRALETFHTAEMLPTHHLKLYPNLPDAKLTEALEAVVKKMDPTAEDIATAVTWIEVIDTTRRQRNLVGHFAGKRFPKHDVYVFVSKSEKDARKVLGFGVAQHEVHTVVAARSEFREMTKSSKSALDWLAKKVLEWNGRYLKVSPLLNPEWVDFVHQDAWCCC